MKIERERKMQIKAGKFYELPSWEYHHGIGKNWLSKSALSEILPPGGSPRAFKYAQDHPEELDLFDKKAEKFHRGTAFHSFLLEPTIFKDQVVPIETFSGTGSVAARKLWQDGIRESGKTPINPDYLDVMREIERLLDSGEHETALNIIYNPDNFVEKSGFWIDPGTGMKLKTRIDIMAPNAVLWDLKTHSSIKSFQNQAIDLHYDLQAAMGLEGATRITGHEHTQFGFVVFHIADPPYDIEVVLADDKFLKSGREKLDHARNLYRHCTETGKWPGKYLDEVGVLEAPDWRQKQLDSLE